MRISKESHAYDITESYHDSSSFCRMADDGGHTFHTNVILTKNVLKPTEAPGKDRRSWIGNDLISISPALWFESSGIYGWEIRE